MCEDPQQHLDRLRRLLPPGRSVELTILKGHLILEESLDSYLVKKCRRAAPMARARLSFFQKANLFQAFFGLSDTDPRFRFLLELNRIRNRLAHYLEPGDLDADVDQALRCLGDTCSSHQVANTQRRRGAHLRNATFLLAGLMAGMGSGERAGEPGRYHTV